MIRGICASILWLAMCVERSYFTSALFSVVIHFLSKDCHILDFPLLIMSHYITGDHLIPLREAVITLGYLFVPINKVALNANLERKEVFIVKLQKPHIGDINSHRRTKKTHH